MAAHAARRIFAWWLFCLGLVTSALGNLRRRVLPRAVIWSVLMALRMSPPEVSTMALMVSSGTACTSFFCVRRRQRAEACRASEGMLQQRNERRKPLAAHP